MHNAISPDIDIGFSPKYIDFHSHILPHMDDGSSSLDESMRMLYISLKQGVYCIALTPHFYAESWDSIEHFLDKRRRSLEMLKSALRTKYPLLLPGAEVKYFRGISDMDDISSLCIYRSDLLLVEMPFCKWTDYMIDDVLKLNGRKDIRIVLAHIERYISDQPQGVISELIRNGILIQSNAEFFLDSSRQKKALSLLRSGVINFIGSDSHDMRSRSPRLGECYDYIRSQIGEDEMNSFISRLLRSFQPNI